MCLFKLQNKHTNKNNISRLTSSVSLSLSVSLNPSFLVTPSATSVPPLSLQCFSLVTEKVNVLSLLGLSRTPAGVLGLPYPKISKFLVENRSFVLSDLGAKTSSSKSESRVKVRGGEEADRRHCVVCGGDCGMSDSEE